MGLLYSLRCGECGYKKKDLMAGPAPRGPAPEIGICETCKRVVNFHPDGTLPKCKKCRHPLTPALSIESVPCPRCGKALQCIPKGIWD
jgi:C4-type Zn-finger protein